MNKIIFLFILSTSSVFAALVDSQVKANIKLVNKTLQDDEQRKVFNNQIKERDSIKENKTYNMKEINIDEDKVEESCIEIEKINVSDTSIYSLDDFEELFSPYLNNCNGLKNLTNLTNKISNMYIDKGYITSRAYMKGQDLSDGIVDITILEGKIEDILSEGVNTSNIYVNFKEKVLNIRDLEVAIQQAERLKSQSLNLKLVPGKKTGYTVVHILGKKQAEPYYGDVSVNNFGSEKTGEYQISGSFNYENLLDLNDIITVRLNPTDNITKNNNNTFGKSLSYSIPYGRTLFNINYSTSEYKQINHDEFGDSFQSDGDSTNYMFGVNYKLFHSKAHTLELNSGFEYKESNNFLNDTKLDIQSYKLSVLNLGLKHSYIASSYNYYSLFTIYKGLGSEDSFADQESDFIKYVLDLNYTKYFNSKINLRYNFAFRGQYSSNYLYGTEEISLGGPYSVRGFKEAGLSGNTGFYIRNELSTSHQVNIFNISPYIGLDYGYITKDISNIDGLIVGGALGLRTNYKKLDIELFYSTPLKEAKLIEDENDNFFGLKMSYQF